MAPEEKAPYKATITLKGTKPEHIATALQELQYRIAETLGRNSIGIDLAYQELQDKRTNNLQITMEAYL